MRQTRIGADPDRRCDPDPELQEREPPRGHLATGEERRDRSAAESDAEQVDAEHGCERIDGGSENEPEEPYPRELQQQRRTTAQREQTREQQGLAGDHDPDRDAQRVLALQAHGSSSS